MLRHVPLGRMNNLRDLGGYPTVEGRVTAWEHFLRGDTPFGLEEADLRWLLEREITTVIDLRSTAEVNQKPDQLSTSSGFHYYHCPLLHADRMPNLEDDVARGYYGVLKDQKRVQRVFSLMAKAPGGVLFHCTAGKDRTGLISALLLSLAGVRRADILADYQISELYLADIMQKIRSVVPDLSPFAGASKSEYMEGCLDLLVETYGSIPAYLYSSGLTEQELERIRAKLLV